MRTKGRDFAPVVLLFITLNALFIAGRSSLERWGADQDVLIWGNLLLFTITLLSFLMARRGLSHPNPHRFIRSVYSSILIKLFACMITALLYIAIYKTDLNKPALFVCMGLYLVYTFLEVSVLMKMLKKSTHG